MDQKNNRNIDVKELKNKLDDLKKEILKNQFDLKIKLEKFADISNDKVGITNQELIDAYDRQQSTIIEQTPFNPSNDLLGFDTNNLEQDKTVWDFDEWLVTDEDTWITKPLTKEELEQQNQQEEDKYSFEKLIYSKK